MILEHYLIKFPNGGAKAMGEYNMQAAYALLLGNRFKMRPNAIYNWANKHNVHLINLIGRVKPRALASAVVANEPLK